MPVTYVALSEDEERIVLATLDPLAAMADAETEALAQLLAGLQPADEALRELLDDLARQHGVDSFAAGLVDPDDVPELPTQPYVKEGELYLLGDHRLLCGDATNPDDVARLLDGGSQHSSRRIRPMASRSTRRGETACTTAWAPPNSPTCASMPT